MASKVDALLEQLLRVDKTPLFCAGGKCGFTEGKHIPTRAELEELVAEGAAEGAEQGERAAVLRIREHSTYRSNLPEAGYYEVDAELLDEFDDDASVLAPKEEP